MEEEEEEDRDGSSKSLLHLAIEISTKILLLFSSVVVIMCSEFLNEVGSDSLNLKSLIG